MRPDRPTLDSRAGLEEYVNAYADRIDGRLGVELAVLDGPDEFDVVASREPERAYASASVIKLPILYALYERYDGDLAALDEPYGLADENRVGGSGLLHLLDGVDPTLADLARAMIAISDNAATNELIDHLGMDAVNDAAGTLGMGRTHLGRKMMTTLGAGDDSDASGDADDSGTDPDADPTNTTSPRDCARFYAELVHGARLSNPAREAMLDALTSQKHGSLFPRYVPYGVELAHKTGGLPTASLDAGIVGPERERPLYFGVFVDSVDNSGDAQDIVAEIGDAAFAWLSDDVAWL
jgi:beta-lactamase class A